MYQLDDVIVYGIQGIYRVDSMTEMRLSKKKELRKYYVLEEVFHNENKIYAPVDIKTVQMRKIISKENAKALIEAIPSIDLVKGKDDKILQQTYQALLASIDPRDWVSILKTIYQKEMRRKERGIKQLAQSDHQLRKLTESLLYGELAISLNISREEVEQYIVEKIEEKETVN